MIKRILTNYRQDIQAQIAELTDYISTKDIDLSDVRLRCESIAWEISKYEKILKQAEAISGQKQEVM